MPLLFDSLFSSVAMSHFMVDVFNASRPVLLTYLGLTETQIALYSAIYVWVSALTQPFFGWMSDRVGPRWLGAGGVLWMTLFYAGAVYIPGTLGLLSLIIAALGSSAFHPVGAVQATLQGRHRLQGRETTAASLFFMAGQMGHFIGPVITGLILFKLGLPAMIILPVVSIPIGFALLYQLRHNHPHPKAKDSDGKIRLQASGCVTSPVYTIKPIAGPPACAQQSPDREFLLGLAVSGGGSRAALFAASAYEALGYMRVGPEHRSLLEQVTHISSVSREPGLRVLRRE